MALNSAWCLQHLYKPSMDKNLKWKSDREGLHFFYKTSCVEKNTHTHTHPFNGPFSRTTRVGRYQKGKTNLDFTEARDSSGGGISWAYASLHLAPDRITTPAPHHSVFTGRMPFLPPNQQRQSTEGWTDSIKERTYLPFGVWQWKKERMEQVGDFHLLMPSLSFLSCCHS